MASGNWRMFSDVHVLDCRLLEWRCVLADDGAIPARRGHSAALHVPSGRVIIFGGVGSPLSGRYETESYLADTVVLHTEPAYEWETPKTCGSPPAPRRGHRAVIAASSCDTYVVVGGYPHDDARLLGLNDAAPPALPLLEPRMSGGALIGVHALRLATWRWEECAVSGHVPRGLALFACACVGPRLFVFGGHEFADVRADSDEPCCRSMWTCDLSALTASAEPPLIVDWELVHSDAQRAEPAYVPPSVTTSLLRSAHAPHRSLTLTPSLSDHARHRGHAPTRAVRARGHLCVSRRRRAMRPEVPTDEDATSLAPTRHPPPSSRFCAEMVVLPPTTRQPASQPATPPHPASPRLMVFGGSGPGGTTLSDMHAIDVYRSTDLCAPPLHTHGAGTSVAPDYAANTHEWRFASTPAMYEDGGAKVGAYPERPLPCARNGMTLTAVGPRLVLFGGGVYGRAYYNDCWAYEQPGVTSPLPPLPTPPPASHPIYAHLSGLVGSSRYADVMVELGDGGPAVPAHRVLLCSGCSAYFLAVLDTAAPFREAQSARDGVVTLTLPIPLTRPTLLVVLRWLYTGCSPAVPLAREDATSGGDATGGGGGMQAEAAQATAAVAAGAVVPEAAASDAAVVDVSDGTAASASAAAANADEEAAEHERVMEVPTHQPCAHTPIDCPMLCNAHGQRCVCRACGRCRLSSQPTPWALMGL
jgi:hypothetical protein